MAGNFKDSLIDVTPVESLCQEAMRNTRSSLPIDTLEDYVLALANYNFWLQSEINKAAARIDFLEQSIDALISNAINHSLYIPYEEKRKLAINKCPKASEMYKEMKSLNREIILTQFITSKIEAKRQSYENLIKRKKS